MSIASHSQIKVPHSGGFLCLTVDIPDHDALTTEEAKFIDEITGAVYGRLRDILIQRANDRLAASAVEPLREGDEEQRQDGEQAQHDKTSNQGLWRRLPQVNPIAAGQLTGVTVTLHSTYCVHRRRATWDDQDGVWYHDDDATTCPLEPAYRERGSSDIQPDPYIDRMAADAQAQGFRRFRYYRTDPPAEYVKTGAAVSPEQPQFEGVQFSDGTVCLHWYTLSGSHAVWPSMAEVMQIHGHPEYGGRFEWLDKPVNYEGEHTSAQRTSSASGATRSQQRPANRTFRYYLHSR